MRQHNLFHGPKSAFVLAVRLGLILALALLALPAAAAEPESDWEVLIPEGAVVVDPIAPAPRVNTLEGKTIGLWWNGKPNGDIFISRVGERLLERVKDIKLIKLWEVEPLTTTTSGTIAKDVFTRIAKECDLIIASQAD